VKRALPIVAVLAELAEDDAPWPPFEEETVVNYPFQFDVSVDSGEP